jgi:hypothetical protein
MNAPAGWIGISVAAAALLTASPGGAAASCDGLQGCAAKACRLDAQIEVAKSKGNASKLTGLERERREMAHCTDEGLKQKRKVALEQAQKRIDQRAVDLDKAQASGDAGKIRNAQRKLDSARKAYAEVEHSPL